MITKYGLLALPGWMKHDGQSPKDGDLPRWSGRGDPPAIGETVEVGMNAFGKARVTGYFVEGGGGGFLGIETKLERPPAFYVKQSKANRRDPKLARFFGADLRNVPNEAKRHVDGALLLLTTGNGPAFASDWANVLDALRKAARVVQREREACEAREAEGRAADASHEGRASAEG